MNSISVAEQRGMFIKMRDNYVGYLEAGIQSGFIDQSNVAEAEAAIARFERATKAALDALVAPKTVSHLYDYDPRQDLTPEGRYND